MVPAEQLPDRLAGSFADQVPKGEIGGAKDTIRELAGTATLPFVERLPKMLRAHRILSKKDGTNELFEKRFFNIARLHDHMAGHTIIAGDDQER